MKTHRLFDLPLGSRFRYLMDRETVYVLIDKAGAGMVDAAGRAGLRGVYAAATSPEAFASMLVEVAA